MSLIGLDIGTTGCKAIVFAADGRILARPAANTRSRRRILAGRNRTPKACGRWLGDPCARCCGRGRRGDPPRSLALSCQGEAVIPVDAGGRALRPAILGMDTRTDAQNAWLREHFGADVLFQRTGMPVHTINTLPKLLWLQATRAGDLARRDQFLLYEDFFLRRLSGEARHQPLPRVAHTDDGHLATGDWAATILDRCGIESGAPGRPAPLERRPCRRRSRRRWRRRWAFSADVLLASGGHDQACAALGVGVTRPGLAMVSTGTAEVVEVALASPALDAARCARAASRSTATSCPASTWR